VDSLNGDLMVFAATMMPAEDYRRAGNAAGVVGVKAARPKKGT